MPVYKDDDLFFDIEIRGNFFVCSQYYPKTNKLIVSYLEQTPTKRNPNAQSTIMQSVINNGPNDFKIIPNKHSEQVLKDKIIKTAHTYKNSEISFENLGTRNGILSFATRYGYMAKLNTTPSSLYNFTASDHQQRRKQTHFPIIFDTDHNYHVNTHGLRIGYNSQNYDQTMLAFYLGDALTNYLYAVATSETKNEQRKALYEALFRPTDTQDDEDLALADAVSMCQFNKRVFDPKTKYMNNALDETGYKTHKNSNLIYRLWKISNRFIDVSNMNPKKISLKRCAMAMGLKIEESNTNRSPNEPLNSLNEIAEVVAYNANDVYITMKVLELGLYSNRFEQNKQLLKEFPYLIYQQNQKSALLSVHQYDQNVKHIDWIKSEDTIRPDRLTINDTSTKFVENVIAPYKNTKIQDNKTLNLTYPDAQIAKQRNQEGTLPRLFHGHPRNVLDYIQDMLNRDYQTISPVLAQQVQRQYDKIKAYYRQFIGKNFNSEVESPDHPAVDLNKMPKSVLVRYITPDGVYHDSNNIGLASYAVISAGGAHGVEVRQAPFQKDYEEYQNKLRLVNDTVNALNNLTSDQYHELFEDDQHDHLPQKVTTKTLGDVISKIHPSDTWKNVKQLPIIGNPAYVYQDLLPKSVSRSKCHLAKIKEPQLFDGSKVKDKYSYTSSDPSNHEDFDSYYPSLISNLAIFRNVDGNDVFTEDLYHPRLKLKKVAKGKVKTHMVNGIETEYTESEVAAADLRQLSMKLLINAASGGGDASFSSKIKCNNKMIAMRIIGQLFCWYIGQTLALHGARVPSTNTDGLYTMNIDKNINDQLVNNCAKQLLLKIGPEYLNLFVSKDANNRLETNKKFVGSARGGSLTSWQGPSPSNSIAHPAIVDYVLAQYLAFEDDAVNHNFDKEKARNYLMDFIKNPPKFYGQPPLTDADILRFLQFPTVSKPGSWSYIFKINIHKNENGEQKFEVLNPTNRVFLVKPSKNHPEEDYTMSQTGLQTLQVKQANKRLDDKSMSHSGVIFKDIINQDPIAKNVMIANTSSENYTENLLNKPYIGSAAKIVADRPRDVTIKKISGFPKDHPALIYNEDLHEISHDEYLSLINERIDYDAYIDLVQTSFDKQWKN